MALEIDDRLNDAGVSATVFAYWIHSESLRERVQNLESLPPSEDIDLLVYHLSIGHQIVSDLISNRSDTLAIVYHNITPPDRYRACFPDLARDLERGRDDLVALSTRSVVALADSAFNARELMSAGYRNVHEVPAGVDPSRLDGAPVDAPLLRMIESEFPSGFVLVVGQVLPHKRVEQCIETVHLLNSTYRTGLGLVVCGAQRLTTYYRAVAEHAKTLPFVGVKFSGPVSDQHLATYYRAATCLLVMSDHEGLCIPPLEAMNVGLPVVTKNTGALGETVGAAGLVLPRDGGPTEAAEGIRLLMTDVDLRRELVANGYRRIRAFRSEDSTTRACNILLGACR
jgi:glycosyltransferase involved in cell wall biosynthesis